MAWGKGQEELAGRQGHETSLRVLPAPPAKRRLTRAPCRPIHMPA